MCIGRNETCGDCGIKDTCVAEIVCPPTHILLNRGSSQEGCWRPRFAKLADVKVRMCNFCMKKMLCCLFLFCSVAVSIQLLSVQ